MGGGSFWWKSVPLLASHSNQSKRDRKRSVRRRSAPTAPVLLGPAPGELVIGAPAPCRCCPDGLAGDEAVGHPHAQRLPPAPDHAGVTPHQWQTAATDSDRTARASSLVTSNPEPPPWVPGRQQRGHGIGAAVQDVTVTS